jgi:hypothetical protein
MALASFSIRGTSLRAATTLPASRRLLTALDQVGPFLAQCHMRTDALLQLEQGLLDLGNPRSLSLFGHGQSVEQLAVSVKDVRHHRQEAAFPRSPVLYSLLHRGLM